MTERTEEALNEAYYVALFLMMGNQRECQGKEAHSSNLICHSVREG